MPTRGQVKDIGRGISHKTHIVGDWLAGYTFSDIQYRRWHSIASIERYCGDFLRVLRLHTQGMGATEIRICIGLSERLICEYLDLYRESDPDCVQLEQLLATPDSATDEPAVAKRGRWLP